MRLKFIPLLLIGIFLIFYYFMDLPLSFSSEIAMATERSSDLHTTSREILPFLENLLDDKSQEATKQLEKLAFREDVIGYIGNLALAERAIQEDSPADLFFYRALFLYNSTSVRFQLANWLVENDKKEEAIKEYLLLIPAQEALEALTQLEASPLDVFRALVQGNHHQGVVKYIEEILARTTFTIDERMELLIALGQSYAQLGRYSKALPYLKRAYEEGHHEVTFWYARSLEATSSITAASSLYRELGSSGAQRLGNILQQQGRREEAAVVFSQSDNPMALWQSAMLWEELSKGFEALEIYIQLMQINSRYRDDAAYRAYILLERKGFQATEQMLDILLAYPAWSMRLTGTAHFEVDSPLEPIEPDFIPLVEVLEERGHHEWATIQLAIGQWELGVAEMLGLSDWYLKRGDYYQSTLWGYRALLREKTYQAYTLAYPKPFEDYVQEAAETYRVDPYLIWAVMREESRFQPHAVSSAGALGLMQIMPTTGQDIAGRLGMRISNYNLLNPRTSIIFGTFYLRQMLNMFDENMDKALAAYNGGPSNVLRWSRSPLGVTLEDFPTAITYWETREYITKVLNSYYTYQWIYGVNDL